MAYTEKIKFYKIRSFSQKINATIEFLKQNYKILGKSILVIMGPLAVLNGLLFAKYINFMFGMMQNPQEINPQNPLMFFMSPTYVGFLLLSTFAILLNFCLIFNFMKLYKSRYPEPITVTEVLNASWKDILPLFVIGLLASIMIMAGMIAFIIPGIYLTIILSLATPVYFFEQKGIIGSISHSFKLVRGKWWSTFGLIFISMIMMYAVAMVFIVPFYVFYFISIFSLVKDSSIGTDINAWWFQGGMTLAVMFMLLGNFLSYAVPMVAISFQYFNLAERYESVGLMDEIDKLDETQA